MSDIVNKLWGFCMLALFVATNDTARMHA